MNHNRKLFPSAVRVRSRGYLPHWERDRSFYSVTIRLADSLPREAARKLTEERKALLNAARQEGRVSVTDRFDIDRLLELSTDRELDRGLDSCSLGRTPVAQIVWNAILYFNQDRYEVDTFCIMPNHVHVLFYLAVGRDLADVMRSWKSFTSKEALKVTGGAAPFWQEEYFDRLIRDGDDLNGTRRYIRENPVKAGLRDWKWIYEAGSSRQ